MEIVPVITLVLIVVVGALFLVLILSFAFSKIQKTELAAGNISTLSTKSPIYQPYTLPPSIKVVPSTQPRKLRSDDTQIYYLDKLRNTAKNYRIPQSTSRYQTKFYTHFDDFDSKSVSQSSKPRYTIVNNTLRKSQSITNRDYIADNRYNQVSFFGR